MLNNEQCGLDGVEEDYLQANKGDEHNTDLN